MKVMNMENDIMNDSQENKESTNLSTLPYITARAVEAKKRQRSAISEARTVEYINP